VFGFSSKKTISVVFVDQASGKPIAASEVPLDQLPDTFAIDTNLQLAGDHYFVVQAEPQTKTEFARTKRLTVSLRKVEAIDPKKILFSLPSICGAALPVVSAGAGTGDIVTLHEDDWRQCEFVADGLRQDISVELAGVRRIHAEAAASPGWREIHVRERIAQPIPRGTSWMKVKGLLGEAGPIDGIAFGDRANRVTGAVAVRLPDSVVVWGVEDAGGLQVLCVEKLDTAMAATVAALQRVAAGLSLTLVNWCRCQAYSGSSIGIEGAVGTPWAR